jgi:hypothetical protein
MSYEVDKLLKESIDNVKSDRAYGIKLLNDLIVLMGSKNDLETHKRLGEIAANYLETLQRSNDQLVKLTVVAGKLKKDDEGGLSKKELDQLYSELNRGDG